MVSDRFETCDPVVSPPADKTGSNYGRMCLYAATVIALGGYTAVTAWILSSNTARVYGFAVSHDLPTLVEIVLQICPMLAALFMVPLTGVKDRVIGCLAGRVRCVCPRLGLPGAGIVATIVVSVAIAIATVCATAAAIAAVYGLRPAPLSTVTLLWVAGELTYDLTLIGIFTTTLYVLTRRVWVGVLLFIAYSVFVFVAGPRWGITSYIGFGSSIPVLLTTYSTAPLYDRAAWLLRAYWSFVTLLLLSILYTFDIPPRPLLASVLEQLRTAGRRRRVSMAVSVALLAVCILTVAGLVRLQRYGIARYKAPSQAAVDAALRGTNGETRLGLTHFNIHLTYSPGQETVAVEGVQTFSNPGQPIRTAYFQLPGLMTPDRLEFYGVGGYQLHPLGKYVQVTFANAIPPASPVRVRYRGLIRPAGAFDLSVQAKVLRSAFFLTDADIMPGSRSADCLASSQPRAGTVSAAACGSAENYLMSDRATGTITVVAPEPFGVSSAGAESIRRLAGGLLEHVFTVRSQRLATFLVACARFRKTVVVSKSGTRVQVFRSAAATSDGDPEAPLAESILSFYQGVWPTYPRHDLNIIETPTPLGEAMAFDGAIAISDKIIASRSPKSGAASNLLEFVMAHEIAHQWWGYRVVPTRTPGRLFLLESLPQFGAYKFLSRRGVLSEQDALENEKARYRAAQSRLRNREVPLVQADTANEIAYNKGPFVLLSLDKIDGASLMNCLGSLVERYSYEAHGNTRPDQFVAKLIEALPENGRKTARRLMYGTGLDDGGGR